MQITLAIKQQLLQVLMNLFWKYGLSLKKKQQQQQLQTHTRQPPVSMSVRLSVCPFITLFQH